MTRIGLIINPIAGMGGSVGLKGTDGDSYNKALALGSQPVAPARAKEFVSHITHQEKISLSVAPAQMGQDYVQGFAGNVTVIGKIGTHTSSDDSKRIAKQMLDHGLDLLVFAGGDGTARDVHDAIDLAVPVVGIPSGVKVYSAVFAVSPRAAAELVNAFVANKADLVEEEVLDIDEEAFRHNVLDAKLHGYLLVPKFAEFLQGGKEASALAGPTAENKQEIATYLAEEIDPDALYLLGPGTTVKAITDHLAIDGTLLGVDALCNHELVARDINETEILELLGKHKNRKIVVTPLGGNGFIFGRGNRQFSPAVIKQVGKDNILVVATRDKLLKLDCLRVDTDDLALNRELAGYMDVITGYKRVKLVRVEC